MGRWQPADPWVQACAAKTGLVEGQSCSFQLAGQRLMGACTQKFFPPAAAAPMLCIPAEVLVAGQHCQQSSQRAGDECGYQLGDHMVHGVCGWDEVATRRGCFSATASKFLRLMEDVVARDTASHQVTALIQQLISSSPASASSSASSSSASSSSASSSASPPFASDSMVAVERQAELQFLPLATTCAEAETSGKLPMMLTLASKASLSHQWPPARSFQISSTAAGDKSLLRQAVGSYIAAQLNVTNAFTPAFARVTLEGQYIGVFDFHPSVLSQALPYSPESANSSADQATSAAEQSEAAINSSASEEQLHAVTAADSDTAASAAKSDSSNEGDDADADDDDDDDHGSSDDEEEEEEEDGETLRRKDWQRRAAEAVASLPEPPGSDPRHPRNRVGVAQVLLDYVARSEKEISVSRGQLIGELDHVNGWTRVSNANGSQGWMPSSLLRNVSCKALPSTLYRPLDALNSFKPNSFYPWIGMLPSPWWAPGLRLFRALSSDDRLNDADTTEHQPLVGTKPARLAESVNITSLLAYLAVAAGAKIAHPFGQSELNYALLLDPCTGQLHVVGHDFQAFGATSFTLGDFDQHATSAAYRLVHAALGVSSWRRQYLKFGQQVLQIMASMKEQGILQRVRSGWGSRRGLFDLLFLNLSFLFPFSLLVARAAQPLRFAQQCAGREGDTDGIRL